MVMILGLSGILLFQISAANERMALAEMPPTFQLSKEYAQGDLSADSVRNALHRRDELLKREVVISFVASDGTEVRASKVNLSENPLWISFARDPQGTVTIDREKLKQHLVSYPPKSMPTPQQCTVLSSREEAKGVMRVETDCIAKSGYTYDVSQVASLAAEALENDEASISIPLQLVPAIINDPVHSPDRPLTLLSTGRSNFKGSGVGRKANVRKAINERENNVFIPTDAVFAFNDTLGNVTISNGWHMALTIFEGVNLRPAPGGGICQASTTVYRAALNAGLPILEQKNHSLYVTYYEPYGVGLDATIFPGSQDLKFKNDTGGPIIVQSYTEGDEAIVNMFGYDDQRTVTLTGPYFASTAPEDLLVQGKKLKTNQIVWIRHVDKNGERDESVISAQYKAIPRSLAKKWEATTEIVRGHDENIAIKNSVVAER